MKFVAKVFFGGADFPDHVFLGGSNSLHHTRFRPGIPLNHVSPRALYVGIGSLDRSINIPESLEHLLTGILYRLLNITETATVVVHILVSIVHITFGVVGRGNTASLVGNNLSSLSGIVVTHFAPSTFVPLPMRN